jgi:hypothetical protein
VTDLYLLLSVLEFNEELGEEADDSGDEGMVADEVRTSAGVVCSSW